MSAFTVTEVHGHEDWGDGGEYGPKRTWKLSLEGDQGRTADGVFAELAQKRDSPAPTKGQVLNGQLVEEKGHLKFKRDKPANSFGGGGGRQMSPKKEAEIRRLACQKSGVALLVAEVQLGKDKPGTVSDLLKTRIDWLEKDCIEAGEKAS